LEISKITDCIKSRKKLLNFTRDSYLHENSHNKFLLYSHLFCFKLLNFNKYLHIPSLLLCYLGFKHLMGLFAPVLAYPEVFTITSSQTGSTCMTGEIKTIKEGKPLFVKLFLFCRCFNNPVAFYRILKL